MAIPGLSLPDPATLEPAAILIVDRVQRIPLSAENEYRFEASFTSPITIKLFSGNAELFGTELAPAVSYKFRGTKAAIFTWYGCELEVSGTPDTEYVAEETPMMQAANIHFALEDLRSDASETGDRGPTVMVVGPDNAGKTSLIKTLTAYALKAGRQPVVVNLDPKQGLLGMPGSLTATTMTTLLDVEEGWGSSPISGPSALPVKMPLCFHYGCQNPEDNEKLFKPLVSRLAVAITGRMVNDPAPKAAGCLMDTSGSLSTGRAGGYELIEHITSEFSVDVILVLGSERVFSDVKKRFATTNASRSVKVIKIDKSGGCVDRSESYMKQFRQQQIKEYFYGHSSIGLSPFTQFTDFDHVTVYRINDASSYGSSFNPGDGEDDDEDDYQPIVHSNALHEKIAPSLMLQNTILAVTHADSNDTPENIRDASVMWYVYIADVDDGKKRLKIVSPISGRVPLNALLWGGWPEGVPDLVA